MLGPLPPPFMGPAIATEIILKSRIHNNFKIFHLDTNTHESLSTLGTLTLRSVKTNLGLYLKMINLIIKHQPNLVLIPISQTTVGFIKDSVFILISRLFQLKTLLQLRGGNFKQWLDRSSGITRIYVSWILKRTQGIIVLGEKLRYQFNGYFNKGRIFVVPNGANFNFLIPQKSNSDKIKLLYLSNLQPSKGIEDVIEAFILLKKNYSDSKYEVDIVGSWLDENTKNKCNKLTSDNNLSINYHPPAFNENKLYFLQNADILIFPPREPEGHPWVIVEAMAAGLPIISTDQGAITQSVIDGVNGFIVEKQSPKHIAEKITYLIDNPEIRIKMGKESRRLYEENFTEEKMVERLTHAFNAVLNG